MKPVFQTILAPPRGNCLQACIASILELPLEAVPNFMEVDGDGWEKVYQDFLETKGLQVLYLDIDGIKKYGWSPRGYHLIQGKSPRGDWDHVCVGFRGEIVHDPHPDGGGLRTQDLYDVFVSMLKC